MAVRNCRSCWASLRVEARDSGYDDGDGGRVDVSGYLEDSGHDLVRSGDVRHVVVGGRRSLCGRVLGA